MLGMACRRTHHRAQRAGLPWAGLKVACLMACRARGAASRHPGTIRCPAGGPRSYHRGRRDDLVGVVPAAAGDMAWRAFKQVQQVRKNPNGP